MKEETKKKLTALFSKYPLKKFKKGQVVFEAGEDFNGVYFVKSGYLRVYDVVNGDKESGIHLSRPLFYLSFISAKTGLKNRHFIECMTPVEAWVVTKEDFVKEMKENPGLSEELNALVMEKFLETTSYMAQLVSGDARTKIISLIYAFAQDYGVYKNKQVTIKIKITHKLIASFTGLTRETVTLQMLKLEKDGLIDNDKRQIVVEDMKRLKKELGYE